MTDGSGFIDVSSLSVSKLSKDVILKGYPEFLDFQSLHVSDSDKQKKTTHSTAEVWLVFEMLRESYGPKDIELVFSDPKNLIGSRYRSTELYGPPYLSRIVSLCVECKSKHPNTTGIHIDKIAERIESEFSPNRVSVQKIVKVMYDPPQYRIFVRTPNQTETEDPTSVQCSLEEIVSYKKFKQVFFSAHNSIPPPMKQQEWEAVVNSKEFEIEKIDKKIAGPEGEALAALEEWIEEARPQKAGGEGNLEYLPVIEDETGKTLLRLPAFMRYLYEQQIVCPRRTIVDVLRKFGYVHTRKRFGKNVRWIWVGSSNGKHEEKAN